jgi:antitoxin (DNA-binding transcriptional repressor) of toxin-antitoxin stability system
MRSVGLKVLKNKLSEYVRLAAEGETILVTDRDRVVAEIGPPGTVSHRSERKLSGEELIAKGVREGWLTPARVVDKTPPPRNPVMPLSQVLAELDNDREDR